MQQTGTLTLSLQARLVGLWISAKRRRENDLNGNSRKRYAGPRGCLRKGLPTYSRTLSTDAGLADLVLGHALYLHVVESALDIDT